LDFLKLVKFKSVGEEGGDEVKSARCLCPGPHTSYNGEEQRAWRDGNVKRISEISPQFRLRAATRPHEVGIGSNRGSAGRGEYVLESYTHCPSNQQSRGHLKFRLWRDEGELGDGG